MQPGSPPPVWQRKPEAAPAWNPFALAAQQAGSLPSVAEDGTLPTPPPAIPAVYAGGRGYKSKALARQRSNEKLLAEQGRQLSQQLSTDSAVTRQLSGSSDAGAAGSYEGPGMLRSASTGDPHQQQQQRR